MAALLTSCPGQYCGRTLQEDGLWSDCAACPRGYHVNSSSACIPCEGSPVFYDWLYLCFMVLFTLVLHCIFIDCSCRRKFSKKVLALHLCAAVETIGAAISTVLLTDPIGSFSIRSCVSHRLADWYTLFHNPSPNYEETLHCTQEAVFPLYTMVFIFYAIAVVFMLLLRPILISNILKGPSLVGLPTKLGGRVSVHIALYFFPQLAGLHAICAGLIYYSFPYIVIVASLMSSAAHFAVTCDQSITGLMKSTVRSSRNMVIVLSHWAMNAFGVVAVTQLADPVRDSVLIALSPLPTIFYILTAYYTDPNF